MTITRSGVAVHAATPDDPVIERALRLWSEPLPDDDALDAFRDVYADTVVVNGDPTDLAQLVARAAMLKAAITPIHHRVDATVVAAGQLAIAFTISGRHTGPLTTPLGEIAPTQRDVTVHGLDIFEIDEDSRRITAVWAVADWLGLLLQTHATT